MPPATAHVQLCESKGQAGDKLRTRTWIEIVLVGEDDSPIPGEKYALTLPGGQLLEGKLDENGSVKVEGLPPGWCKVSFPGLDREAWTSVESGEPRATGEGAP